MRRRLLDLVCCPICRGTLALTATLERGEEILEGELACACGRAYPVNRGVPRLLADPPHDGLADLKRRTIDAFGHEWTEWGRYGWTDGERPTDA
jgi:uncharacterized protein YbaR (Trm112 family)